MGIKCFTLAEVICGNGLEQIFQSSFGNYDFALLLEGDKFRAKIGENVFGCIFTEELSHPRRDHRNGCWRSWLNVGGRSRSTCAGRPLLLMRSMSGRDGEEADVGLRNGYGPSTWLSFQQQNVLCAQQWVRTEKGGCGRDIVASCVVEELLAVLFHGEGWCVLHRKCRPSRTPGRSRTSNGMGSKQDSSPTATKYFNSSDHPTNSRLRPWPDYPQMRPQAHLNLGDYLRYIGSSELCVRRVLLRPYLAQGLAIV